KPVGNRVIHTAVENDRAGRVNQHALGSDLPTHNLPLEGNVVNPGKMLTLHDDLSSQFGHDLAPLSLREAKAGSLPYGRSTSEYRLNHQASSFPCHRHNGHLNLVGDKPTSDHRPIVP